MKAIRGATTLKFDTPEEIRDSVSCLLNEIKVRNCLNEGDFQVRLIYVLFILQKQQGNQVFSTCRFFLRLNLK